MVKHLFSDTFIVSAFLAMAGMANASESAVPEPFQKHDPSSSYSISYDDVDALLKATVADLGRSTRKKASSTQAKTGTRMKTRVNRSTIDEGNRFSYELFQDSPENREMLNGIRRSLEQIPDQAPLQYFTRTEQLAYWLNLYNITLLSEIVAVYPERSLKKLLTGRGSILSKKILTVAGIPLSLNDIQFTILKGNYESDPLIMYGLYQGIIGGPNIRDRAYTGENVYRYLAQNAAEFVNSNRGTYAKNESVFKVSSLYERNKVYFKDYESDLRAHLLDVLEGEERGQLLAAKTIKADINDWTVTDLYGSYKQIGGSLADNPAAMLDSVQRSTSNGEGGVATFNMPTESATMASKSTALNRFSPELVLRLKEIDSKQMDAADRKSRVTMEELGLASDGTNDHVPDDSDDKE